MAKPLFCRSAIAPWSRRAQSVSRVHRCFSFHPLHLPSQPKNHLSLLPFPFSVCPRFSASEAFPSQSPSLCEQQSADKSYFSKQFWDVTYSQSYDEPFEWYKSYAEMSAVIRKHIPLASRVLMAGCGDSLLSEDMVKDGYQEIVNIDISPVVIERMKKKYQDVPQLNYMTMNVLDLSSFENYSFHSVIDKGTLDAVMSVAGGPYNVSMMLAEVSRILKPYGTYMLVTFAGPHISLRLLNSAVFGWDISLYVTSESGIPHLSRKVCPERVMLNSDGTLANDYSLDPNSLFIYVCTKVSFCGNILLFLSFVAKWLNFFSRYSVA